MTDAFSSHTESPLEAQKGFSRQATLDSSCGAVPSLPTLPLYLSLPLMPAHNDSSAVIVVTITALAERNEQFPRLR